VKAAVYHGRRDVRVEDVPDPAPPGSTDVLLGVTRAAICGTDAAEWASGPHLIPPALTVVLGHEFTGTIVSAGDAVDGLRPGTRVVAGAGMWCGECDACRGGRTNLCRTYYTLGLQADGGLAEYALVPSRMCVSVPDECSDDAAVMAQPLAIALHAVRRGRVEAGDPVLVLGVGGIGAFVVAAAKARGAAPLVAADVRQARLESAQLLGADAVIDARDGDVVESIRELTGGDGAAVVIEASGAEGAVALAAACARRGGRVVVVGLPTKAQQIEVAKLALAEIDVVGTVAHVCRIDLPDALDMLANGDLARIVVDRVIPLDALVTDGLAPLAAGTVEGKVLVAPVGA
jgi:(R,R)-butanediol dehydrogenase / meso-butanediol dehydrogenase / diacetyl reductase